MDSITLVRALPDPRRGATYSDMAWEPTRPFAVVARRFAAH